MNQGGAIIDLRPYAAKLVRPCGVGTKCLQDASYPFLIQSYYRAGHFTHYAGEGSIKSCKFTYRGQEVDLCACRTWASLTIEDDVRIVTLDPVKIKFDDFSMYIQSIFKFREASGQIEIIRRILETSDGYSEIQVDEYLTACYGTTEYPEDLTGVKLLGKSKKESIKIDYAYKCREECITSVSTLEAVIPQIDTIISVGTDDENCMGYLREGFAFSPMYTIGVKKTLTKNQELITWLKVEKAS